MDQAEKDRKDAERLDWLDSYVGKDKHISVWRTLLGYWLVSVGNGEEFEDYRDEPLTDARKTIREVIDEAIRTTEPLLVAPPLTMSKAISTLKASLNQCVDDYDLTSNDTRRGD